jgi:hypothetical protein
VFLLTGADRMSKKASFQDPGVDSLFAFFFFLFSIGNRKKKKGGKHSLFSVVDIRIDKRKHKTG